VILGLPFPPSINSYYGRGRNGSVYIKQKGKEYRNTVMIICQMRRIKPMHGRLCVLVRFYPPDRRIRDLDNIEKALFDALQHGGVYLNDNQIDDKRTVRCEPVKDGKIVIELKEIKSDGTSED